MSAPEFDAPEPDFPSGEWVGFYRDHGTNHRQDMHLSFAAGSVTGSGSDDIGRFTIRGRYDAQAREVWWTKTYPGSHDVHYRGFREVRGIWGVWDIKNAWRGGFHIWPRARGEGARAAARAEQEVPIATPVPC